MNQLNEIEEFESEEENYRDNIKEETWEKDNGENSEDNGENSEDKSEKSEESFKISNYLNKNEFISLGYKGFKNKDEDNNSSKIDS